MKLSQKVKYGAACLFELSHHTGEFVDTEAVSISQRIPYAYTQKVLQALARAGLISSWKGVGYKLLRPLSDISALDVIEALTIDSETLPDVPAVGNVLEEKINQTLKNMNLGELSPTR